MSTPTTETFLARIQTDPQGDNPAATAFFGSATTIDGVVYQAPWQAVNWPLNADTEITVGGTTMTYAEVSAFVVAIAYQEKATQAVPAAV